MRPKREDRKVQRFNVHFKSQLNQLIVYHMNQTEKLKREKQIKNDELLKSVRSV